MSSTEGEKCPFLFGGKCTVENIDAFRDVECTNEAKDACCYTCTRRKLCEIGCDSLDEASPHYVDIKTQADMRGALISGVQPRQEDKWGFCVILGALSVMMGGLWMFRIAWPAEYWNGVLLHWSSYMSSGKLGDLLSFIWFATPLLLVVLGLALAGIGILMLQIHINKRISERKSAMVR